MTGVRKKKRANYYPTYWGSDKTWQTSSPPLILRDITKREKRRRAAFVVLMGACSRLTLNYTSVLFSISPYQGRSRAALGLFAGLFGLARPQKSRGCSSHTNQCFDWLARSSQVANIHYFLDLRLYQSTGVGSSRCGSASGSFLQT